METPERLARYLRPDELHTAFNFEFLLAPWDAEAMRAAIDASIAALTGVGRPPTWVLSNHDVVRHVTRYGGGDLGRRRARAAALLMLALPGGAYVYQGDELGLPEVDRPARRGAARTRRSSAPAAPSGAGTAAGCRCRGRATPRRSASARPAPATRGCPSPTTWAALTAERQAPDPRLDADALPRRPPSAARAGTG